MTNEIYQYSLGVTITVDADMDLTAAASYCIKVLLPESGEEMIWYPTLNGTKYLVYITASGDLDEVGMYAVQASAEWGDPVCSRHWGRTAYFEVFEEYTP